MEPGFAAAEIDTSKPHPARMYNAYLGGNDNYPADRAAVRQILRDFPEVRGIALANRAFLQRAVRFLAAEAGIRQFIDIGTGIPSAGNVHEVAGRAAPDTRVVYVDNDPIVHVHANALLAGTGTTGIVLADLREPAAILADPRLRELIDFTRPVALLLVAILHFIRDEEDPAGIVATMRDALPPGSYLVLTHGTQDFHPPGGADMAAAEYKNAPRERAPGGLPDAGLVVPACRPAPALPTRHRQTPSLTTGMRAPRPGAPQVRRPGAEDESGSRPAAGRDPKRPVRLVPARRGRPRQGRAGSSFSLGAGFSARGLWWGDVRGL